MTDKTFITESKDFVADNASSWFVQETIIGDDKNISMTFVKYIHKVIVNSDEVMTGESHLSSEAIATITLSENVAKAFAEAILLRVK